MLFIVAPIQPSASARIVRSGFVPCLFITLISSEVSGNFIWSDLLMSLKMWLLLIRVPKSFTELGENTVIFKFLSEMFYCKTCQKAIQIFVFFVTLVMCCRV